MTLLAPVVAIYVNGAWTNITTAVRVEDGITIQRGRQDEQGSLGPGTCTMTLNNVDGRFSPRNPLGPYYGSIGRNTLVRVSMGGVYRFWGEISAWPARWEVGQKYAWVTVQAAGITRRLTQGPKALSGPITRFVGGASNVFAYWPCEDAQGATSVASGLPTGTPMSIEGTSPVHLAADSTFPTSDPLPVLNNGALYGAPNTNTAGDHWLYFLLSVPVAGDTDDTTLVRVLESSGSARWEVRYFTASSGSLLLRCFDSAGGSLLTSSSVTGLNGVPSIIAVKFDQSGANTNYSIIAYKFSDGTSSTISGSIANTMTAVSAVQINADRAAASITVGHILLTSTDQTATVLAAMRGYAGEVAATRFSRLCAEEGITGTVVGTAADSEAMGPQTAMTLMDLLNQCEAADGGFLFEPRDSVTLAYRTRTSMYAGTADLTLPYTAAGGSSMDVLEPVDDDQGTRNAVTVARINGSSATYEVTTGTMSTSAPPAGVGRYDVKYDLSLYTDGRCLPIAEWKAHLGTLDEPRYPSLTSDFNKLTGGTLTNAIALDIGDSIKVTGTPKWVPPSGIQALVVGYVETITQTSWRVQAICAQGSVWASPFTLNDTVLGRLDSSTTTTNGTLTTTATSVPYTGGTWITTATHPTEFPFGIVISGEEMTVTSATGTTFTVTRSVNGIVKTHAVGEEIHLAQQNRIML